MAKAVKDELSVRMKNALSNYLGEDALDHPLRVLDEV